MEERTSDIQDEKMEEGERKDAGDEERKDLEEEKEDAGQDEGRDADVLMEKETDADCDTEQVILDKCENMETEVHKEDPDVDPEVDDDYDEERKMMMLVGSHPRTSLRFANRWEEGTKPVWKESRSAA